jgi:hypothetical protein
MSFSDFISGFKDGLSAATNSDMKTKKLFLGEQRIQILRQHFEDANRRHILEVKKIRRLRHLRAGISGIQPNGGRVQLYEECETKMIEYNIYVCKQWPEFLSDVLGLFRILFYFYLFFNIFCKISYRMIRSIFCLSNII